MNSVSIMRVVAWLYALALPLGFISSSASASRKPVVAVFDIEDKSKRFGAEELDQLSTYLSAQIASGGAYQVVPRAQIKDAFAQQKTASYDACYDEKCQIEIGKELAAEKTILTQIIAVGTKCAVTSTMYDLARSASEKAATEKSACDQDSLVTALERVAATLTGKTPAPAAAADDSMRADRGVAAAEVRQTEKTVARSQRLERPSRTPSVLKTVGWSLFGIAYVGEIVGVIADPWPGQVGLAFIPVVGPVLVDGVNIENMEESSTLNIVAAVTQGLGLALAIAGWVLEEPASDGSTANLHEPGSSPPGMAYVFGFDGSTVSFGGRF